jgi:putative FmdB family regulatory protein
LPTYEYRCVSCEHQFERFQRMSDEPVKECEVCGEPVKRLLFPVAIHFKGNGFYSTDYARKNALGSSGTSSANGGSAESSSASDDKGSAGDDKGSASSATPPATKTSKPEPAATAAKND